MGSARNIDEEVFLQLNGAHNNSLDHLMTIASNLFLCFPILFLVIFLMILHFKKENQYPITNSLLIIFVLGVEFIICLELVPQIFGYFIQRDRPCINPHISDLVRMVGENCNDNMSFFSVRPFIMFFITSFLFFSIKKEFPLMKASLVIWSLIVAYSRIYVGMHYPLNVVFAIIVGISFGFAGSKLYRYLRYDVLVI